MTALLDLLSPLAMQVIISDIEIDIVHVNIIMLHVDIIYLAYRRQKYATIEICPAILENKIIKFANIFLPFRYH